MLGLKTKLIVLSALALVVGAGSLLTFNHPLQKYIGRVAGESIEISDNPEIASAENPSQDSSAAEDLVPVPLVPPDGGFKIAINGGEASTVTSDVHLAFNAGTDANQVAVSNSSDFTDAVKFDLPAEETAWDICRGTAECASGEEYTVFAKFYNPSGASSEAASASIAYDKPAAVQPEAAQTEQTDPEQQSGETPAVEQTDQTEQPDQTEPEQQPEEETAESIPPSPVCLAQPLGRQKEDTAIIQRTFREALEQALADFSAARERQEDMKAARAERAAAIDKARADRANSLGLLIKPTCTTSDTATPPEETQP
ncbi:MAG: hypothetical protein ACM3NH_02960 [Candidatus Saccharibacteria bacterium]